MDNPVHTNEGAETFLDTLNAHGVSFIFLNPGIDIVPIQAAVAKYRSLGRDVPQVILCPHESVVVSAAHGCAAASGKPQVAAVFQDVGTLQAGGAIPNLKYGRAPVVLCAGRNSAPLINWRGEPADQLKIVRDYVKWDHAPEGDEDIGSVLTEALRIASAEPRGPVYLTIPRELLTGRRGQAAVSGGPIPRVLPGIDRSAVSRAAQMLMDAKNPLILTAFAGRHPEAVPFLVELAETLGARAITTDLRMSFPSTHPLCPGIDAVFGDTHDHYIPEADVLLLVDYDFPGPIPKRVVPATGAKIIQIDIEPLKRGKPLWGRDPDVLMEGDSRELLKALNRTVKEKVNSGGRAHYKERYARIAREHEKSKESWRTLARSYADRRPISTDWLCHCIDEALDEDAVIVHMIPSTADAIERQIRRTKPGTMYCWGDSAGSMGWSLGAALGVKLAMPERLVVSLTGDGGFIYGCPVATLWSARAYHAPFLTVIFNNHCYQSIRMIVGMEFGEQYLSGDMGFQVGTDMLDPPDFGAVAAACGAFGQTIEDPSGLPSALKTAVAEVRGGRSAVLNVMI